MTYKTYAPSVKNETRVEHPNPTELLFRIIRDSPYQLRNPESMIRNPLLDEAAERKAHDLAINNYFAHTSPAGVSANQNVRATGYVLPDRYPVAANNVESLSIGGKTLAEIAQGWYTSNKHRPHVYAENDFYRNQTCIGVGTAIAQDGRVIFVFISAPCP